MDAYGDGEGSWKDNGLIDLLIPSGGGVSERKAYRTFCPRP